MINKWMEMTFTLKKWIHRITKQFLIPYKNFKYIITLTNIIYKNITIHLNLAFGYYIYLMTWSRWTSLCWSQVIGGGFVRFLSTFLKSICRVSKWALFLERVFPFVKSWPVLRSKALKLNFGDWFSNSLDAPLEELLWFELLLPGLNLFWPSCCSWWLWCCWYRTCCWYIWWCW